MPEPRVIVNVNIDIDLWTLISKEIQQTKEKPQLFIKRILKEYFIKIGGKKG